VEMAPRMMGHSIVAMLGASKHPAGHVAHPAHPAPAAAPAAAPVAASASAAEKTEIKKLDEPKPLG
jgi:hypothetical protein